MKTRVMIGIGLGLVVSCSTWAEESLDPAQLGTFDGMLNVCVKMNPGGASAYNTLRKTMIGQKSDGAIEALTQTPEYREAYEAARQKSEAEPHDKALKDCTQLAAALTPHAPQGKRHK
jgi:hypothetical protein